MNLEKVEEKLNIKKRKKREERFCLNQEVCVYKSYFGHKCFAHNRIIWSTCRYKSKTKGEGNANTKT